jgi:hypothetical protein
MTVTITAFERSPDEGKVRRSSNSQPPGCWRATSPGIRSACLWSRIAFATG